MKKLILFDIDGTLLYHVGKRPWKDQYSFAAEKVFGKPIDFDPKKLNGRIERDSGWQMVKDAGISRAQFDSRFEAYVAAMHEYLETESRTDPLYEVITSAHQFVELLAKHSSRFTLGIITGNARKTGEWKLTHSGLDRYFRFGLYGDEAEDRIQLAGTVFPRYEAEYGHPISAEDVVIIGDTIYDIRCGRAIGATTIAVTTGLHGDRNPLAAEEPDFLVDTLMDPTVLQFFSIQPETV